MNRTKIEELQASIQKMTSKLEEQSGLLNEVLLENTELKSELRNSQALNEKLQRDVDELKQSISRLESRL